MRFIVIQKEKNGTIGFFVAGSNPPFVKKIILDTPASSSSIAKGDLIFKVNGIDVSKLSYERTVEIMKDCGPFLLLQVKSNKVTNTDSSNTLLGIKHLGGTSYCSSMMSVSLSDSLHRASSLESFTSLKNYNGVKKSNKSNYFITTPRGIAFILGNPAYLCVLLLYCQSETKHLFTLLFYLIVEVFERKKQRNWQIGAYEIYSIFLHPSQAHLKLDIENLYSTEILKSINNKDVPSQNIFSDLKSVMTPLLDEVCESYYTSCIIGNNNEYGSDAVHPNMKRLEMDMLIHKMLKEFYKRLESTLHDEAKISLVKSVISTTYQQIGYNPVGVFSSPSDRALLKYPFEYKNKIPRKVKNHSLSEIHCKKDKICSFCSKVLSGPAPQGFFCSNCEMTFHTTCVTAVDFNTCGKRTRNATIGFARKNTEIRRSDKKVGFATFSEKAKLSTEPRSISYTHEICDPDIEYPSELPMIPKSKYPNVTGKRMKLMEVTNEFIHTERSHLRNIKILNYLFRSKIVKKSSFAGLVELLFPNLIQLTQFHEKFSNDLKGYSDNLDQPISHVLIDNLEEEEFVFAASCFCRDQRFSLNRYRVVLKNDPKLMSIISESEQDALCGKRLFLDLMVGEMQRVTKYPLLIKQILKYSEEEEKELAQRAYDVSVAFLSTLIENVTLCENSRRIDEISKGMDIKSGDPNFYEFKNISLEDKNLIYEGNMIWHVNKKCVEILGLLFDDMLVLLQICENRYVLKTISHKPTVGPKVHLTPILKLNSIFAPRSHALDGRIFYIPVSIPEAHLYEFETPSNSIKTEWIDNLTKSINIASSNTLLEQTKGLPEDISDCSPDNDCYKLNPTKNND